MSVSGMVSIPSSVGSSTVFTVTGTRTLQYATAFQNYLIAARDGGNLNIVQGDTAPATGAVTFAAPTQGMVNEAVMGLGSASVNGGGLSATVPAGYQFLFDDHGGASTIVGASIGMDILVAGINAAAVYFDEGGNNTVVFVDGNNHYVGDTSAGAGNDTVVAGSGFDTIDTGAGRTTVDSGTGRATINLNDTAAGAIGTYNDNVYLDDGYNTVNANGMRDDIVANAPGQTIDGGLSASQYDCIVLLGGNGGEDNVVNAGAATVALFDDSAGNSIFGGTGQLIFVGGADMAASIVGGKGVTDMFGASGGSIVFTSADPIGSAVFVAGAGNETLYGALSRDAISLYANNSSAASITSAVQDVLTGGAANDTLVSGAGHETLTGGAGSNLFLIDATTDGVGGTITVTDFGAGAGNLLGFLNYSQSEIQNALNGAYTVTGANGEVNTVLTLSDNTQVTFLDVSSLSGHIFNS